MERITLGVYSRKVILFVLCIVADNQTLAIKRNKTSRQKSNPRQNHTVKLPETKFRLKGFASLFSKSDKDFKSGQIITTS